MSNLLFSSAATRNKHNNNNNNNNKKKKAALAYYHKLSDVSAVAVDEQQQHESIVVAQQQQQLLLSQHQSNNSDTNSSTAAGTNNCSPPCSPLVNSSIVDPEASSSNLISTQRKRKNIGVIATANPSSATTQTITTNPKQQQQHHHQPYYHFFKHNRTCNYYDIIHQSKSKNSNHSNSNMAVTFTFHNPQDDPEQACSPSNNNQNQNGNNKSISGTTSAIIDDDNSQAKKFKPNGHGGHHRAAAAAWLRRWLRVHNCNCCRVVPLRATNLTVVVISCLLISLSVHRVISLWATHRKWINAPITYMHRTCPAVPYPPLLQLQQSLSSNNNGTTTSTSSATMAVGTSTATEQQQQAATPQAQQPQQQAQQPKICLTTLTDQKSPSKFQRFLRWRNFDGILELTWDNKQRYADKHGYYLYDGSTHIDPSRPPAWSKIKAVQHLLNDSDNDSGAAAAAEGGGGAQQQQQQKCDWVMWTDADTVIMNSNIPVASFLPRDDTHDLLVASDKGGGYNSGVFLFRNTPWSRQFLQQWWSMTNFVRPPGLSLSGDNAALKALLARMHDEHTFDAHVLSPPRCTFNSFAKFLTLGQSLRIMDHLEEQPWYLDSEHYHKGDFVAHTPGVDNKAEALQLLLREAR